MTFSPKVVAVAVAAVWVAVAWAAAVAWVAGVVAWAAAVWAAVAWAVVAWAVVAWAVVAWAVVAWAVAVWAADLVLEAAAGGLSLAAAVDLAAGAVRPLLLARGAWLREQSSQLRRKFSQARTIHGTGRGGRALLITMAGFGMRSHGGLGARHIITTTAANIGSAVALLSGDSTIPIITAACAIMVVIDDRI
jgi:hypothetical protein